jgi:type I restriction enzyme, S subunit
VSELSNNKIFKDIPSDWDVKFLGELSLSKPEYGANCPAIEYRHDYPRYVRITDISENGKLRSEDKKSIEPKEVENYLLNKGDIVFARSGATVGKTYLYNESDGLCAFAGYLIRFRPDSKRLLPEFLFQFTQSNWYKNWVKGMLRAGAQPNINGKEYASLPIPLPPIVEQYKITAVLSSVDEAIEKTEAIIEQTEKVKKGLMQQLLTKGIGHTKFKKTEIGEIPEEWEIGTLKDFCDHITKGATPTTYGFSWEKEGILFLRNECIRETGLSFEGSDFISEEAHAFMKRSIIRHGDVLITITGNLGRCCVYDKGPKEANINQHIARVRILSNKLNPYFICYFINSDFMRKKFDLIRTGLAYPQLSLKQIQEIIVPIPPRQEQDKIVKIVQSLDKKNKCENKKLNHLKTIKRGLMQDLLTGKVRVKVDDEVMSQ